jgi:S1-C subfamily serine protease
MNIKVTLLIVLVSLLNLAWAQDSTEFATNVFQSTYKIQGLNGSLGTAFIVGKPTRIGSKYSYPVLITAKHVMDGCLGDSAIVFFRKVNGTNYSKNPIKIPIRNNGKALYTVHPKEDVAALYIKIPNGIDVQILGIQSLTDDSILNVINVHPGMELFVLGFPLGYESNSAGFPILRSGKIASYPIIPTSEFPTFLLDFEVFKGNSGGPVFMNQTYMEEDNFITCKKILGLVSKEAIFSEHIKSLEEEKIVGHKLSLAIIIQARYIKETINLLPKK